MESKDSRESTLDVDSLVLRSLHRAAAALRDPDQLKDMKTERIHRLLKLLERNPSAGQGQYFFFVKISFLIKHKMSTYTEIHTCSKKDADDVNILYANISFFGSALFNGKIQIPEHHPDFYPGSLIKRNKHPFEELVVKCS